MSGEAHDAARRIAEMRINRGVLAPGERGGFPRSEIDGYAVQREVHRLLAMAGQGDLAGYKVGMSAPEQQKRYGLSGPASGGLLANNLFHSGVSLQVQRFRAPGVECELAVTLARDLPLSQAEEHHSILDAIATCHAAIEIVDNRYADIGAMDGPTLIADDVVNAAAVIGPPCRFQEAVKSLRGTLLIDGLSRAAGSAERAGIDPVRVLAWLARHLAAYGEQLRAGQVVLCGSVTPLLWLARPEKRMTVTASFEGLLPVWFHLTLD